MATDAEYRAYVAAKDRPALRALYDNIVNLRSTAGASGSPPADFTAAYDRGKAFEYLLLRAFELESTVAVPVEVTWPFDVPLRDVVGQTGSGDSAEQVDGAVHLPRLSALFESKSGISGKINVEPLAKLRNQLLRRPSGTFGCVFGIAGFTEPAAVLARFMAPQTVLLWEEGEIGYCLREGQFVTVLQYKHRQAVERGVPDSVYPLSLPPPEGIP